MAYGDETPSEMVIKQALELAKTDKAAANKMLEDLIKASPPVRDWRVGEATWLAESSSDQAARRLQLAADYLRQLDHHFPYGLGLFLAEAFDIAALKKTPEERARSLGEELELTARHRRPASPEVGEHMWYLINRGLSKNEAARQVSKKFDVCTKTAKRAYSKVKEIQDRLGDVEE